MLIYAHLNQGYSKQDAFAATSDVFDLSLYCTMQMRHRSDIHIAELSRVLSCAFSAL